ncbi:MAG: J domain-containing protein [Planctomycetes bacterium]|nr:J domain-containing protein [Planctomycetota bacterium]
MAEDYYKTLGLRRDASQAEIQKAYRELARKYHPDLNPDDKGAKQKFQQVQTAFDVLNDAEKRELYDRYGSSFENFSGGGPGGGSPWGGGSGGGGNPFGDFDFSQLFGQRSGGGGQAQNQFSDFFHQFRGGGERPQTASRRRGGDIQHELTIPLATAVTGGEVQLSVRRQTGKNETIAVKIPPGIDEGKKIRVRGQGDSGPSGKHAGDILITIHIAPHECFTRRGNNLLVKVPVTLAEAGLGAKVDVPTPQGTVSLRIPPGTSGGAKLRIKGHGVAPKGGTPGDLLAEIQIVLPEEIDDQGREMFRHFAQLGPQDPRAKLRW